MTFLWHPSEYDHYGFRFRLDYNMGTQATDLRIMRSERGESYHAKPIEFEKHVLGEIFPATLSVPDRENDGSLPFQHLFNALWEMGFRPSARVRQDDIIEAKDSHLADLRKVLFSTLGVS